MNSRLLEIRRHNAIISLNELTNNVSIKTFIECLRKAREYTNLCLNSYNFPKSTSERCLENANSESNQELLLMLKSKKHCKFLKNDSDIMCLNNIFHALQIESKMIDLIQKTFR